MAQQGRVQTPDFRNNLKLAPAARPVDTFEAPAAAPKDNNSLRLVAALSDFSSQLGALAPILGGNLRGANKDANESALAERERFFMGASPEEAKAYIVQKHGLDKADKIQAAAIGRIDGAKSAELDQNTLLTAMQEDFDWDNGDPEAYVRAKSQELLTASGRAGEATYTAAYSRAMSSFAQNVVQMRNKRITEQNAQKVQGAASDYYRMTVDDSVKAGDTADATARKFLDTAGATGSKGTLALDDNEVDDRQIDELTRRTKSNPDVVLAALAMARKGKGGERASFLDDPRTRDKALNLQRLATVTLKEQANAAEKQGVLAGVLSGVQDGRGFAGLRDLEQISPTSGERVLYTVEQQKKDAERHLIEQDDRYAQKAGETRDQTITRRSQTFARIGLQDPDLKAATEGLADGLTPEAMQDPNRRAEWLKKAALVERVTKSNKNIAASMWKGADKEAYDGFMAGREDLGLGDEAAMAFANKVTNPSPQSRARLNAVRPEIDSAVRSLASKGWFGADGTTNGGAVEDHLVSLAEKYTMAGLPADKAVETARATIERNAIYYNGTLVDVGSLKDRLDMPVNFDGSVQAQVDHFVETSAGKIGRGDFRAGDVTIKQYGDKTGTFFLVDKHTQTPVTNDKGEMHSFTLANLKSWDNANERIKDKAEASFNVLSQSVKARGLTQVTDREGNDVWVDKKRVVWVNEAAEGETPVWKKTGNRVNAAAILTSPQGGIELKRPDKLNQRLKVTSEFFTQSRRPDWLSGTSKADPTTEFLNNQGKDTFNWFGNYIKVGDEAEKAINERNRGR